MKRYVGVPTLIIIATVLFTFSCDSTKKKLFSTTEICKGVYREIYTIFSWGAYSADVYSEYLTDSTNFRIKVGIHNDDENFYYHCLKDSIWVMKLSENKNNVFKITDTLKVYDLKVLKSGKKFE